MGSFGSVVDEKSVCYLTDKSQRNTGKLQCYIF